MKKGIVLAICILCMSSSIKAQFKFGIQGTYQASFGGAITNGGGGGFDVGLLGIGGKAHAVLSKKFAGQISVTYLFRNFQNVSSDIDIHYIGFGKGNPEAFKISPFVGFNSSGSTNINIGVNGSFFLFDKLTFFLEPKFMLGTDPQLAIAGGFYF